MGNPRRYKPPKIALVDIETAPLEGFAWGRYEQNIIEETAPGYILSFGVKWLGKGGVRVKSLPEYSRFKSNKKDDKPLVKDLWAVFDQADIIIAHNGRAFDVKKANARFAVHGFKPPSEYKVIDTLKIARSVFKFDSNRLDDLGHYLKVGRKLPHTGKHLWLKCMKGDPAAWRLMCRYNAQDVLLLERVYLKLRAWAPNHPALDVFTRRAVCPTCQSPSLRKHGWRITKTGRKQRFICESCGAHHTDHKHIREL